MDQDSIWEICLEKSFKPWIESCLKDWINLDDHRSYINEIDDLFSSLYSNGLADLLTISFYLQNHDFSGVSSGSEAYRIILEDLKPFTLPKMTGLESKKTRKSFSTYQSAALQFFNYSTFLNAGSRNKALERLNAFRNDPQGPVPDAEQLGDFNDIDGLLDALQDYIENRSEEARQSLYSVDFIYLYEKVLGYKPKNKRTPLPTSKVRKLKGVAQKYFYTRCGLLWQTCEKRPNNLVYICQEINKIMVRSILFKHNFNAGEMMMNMKKLANFLFKLWAA